MDYFTSRLKPSTETPTEKLVRKLQVELDATFSKKPRDVVLPPMPATTDEVRQALQAVETQQKAVEAALNRPRPKRIRGPSGKVYTVED